jgi:menaquinone-9 beta-reductase
MTGSWDVLVAGAGPAGSIAALVLARAGARVLIIDRDAEPRGKLCGDTLNPGAVSLLEELAAGDGPVAASPRIPGWIVTAPGVRMRSGYRPGLAGRTVERRWLDPWLLGLAVAAGARFEGGLRVRGAIVDSSGACPVVRGVTVASRGRSSGSPLAAGLTIAADGRTSVVGRSVGLTRYRPSPRRWAFGTYVTGIADAGEWGEMHVRRGLYLGIARVDGATFNVCAATGARPPGRTPREVLRGVIAADPILAARFADATFDREVRVLGPLGVDAPVPGMAGLLLAGDAAGFIDPMTGDGLHLAMRGGRLAAAEALRVLETGDVAGAVPRLRRARRQAFGSKQRFNRTLARLIDSSAGFSIAVRSATIAPPLIRWLVRRAGDAA